MRRFMKIFYAESALLLLSDYGIMVSAQKSCPIAGGINEKSGHAPRLEA